MMTKDDIHRRIETLADEMQEHYDLIRDGLPQDTEGFPKPENADLADALRVIDKAISVLSRLCYHMNND